MMLLLLCDTDAGTNGMPWQKYSCYLLFWSSWPEEYNGTIDSTITIMWGLMLTPMVSHGQNSFCISFLSSWHKECNGAILTPSMSHDTNANSIVVIWPKGHIEPSFRSSWPKEYNGSTDNAIDIKWWQLQWCHMTIKVTLHLILIILT